MLRTSPGPQWPCGTVSTLLSLLLKIAFIIAIVIAFIIVVIYITVVVILSDIDIVIVTDIIDIILGHIISVVIIIFISTGCSVCKFKRGGEHSLQTAYTDWSIHLPPGTFHTQYIYLQVYISFGKKEAF